MATAFFGGNFFGGEFFSQSSGVAAVKTGTGGIDPGDAKRRIVKPTGLLRLPKKVKEGRKDVSDRIDESRQIQAEIAGRLAREFDGEVPEAVSVVEMSLREIEAEIGVLLRKKLRTEEDEAILLLLLAAAAA